MKYEAITSIDELDLSIEVNTYLADGWKLHGSISISSCVVDGVLETTFAQAMTLGE